jgi:putative transposase
VELGEFVVMPNHFHGIVILSSNAPRGAPDEGVTRRAPTEEFGKPRPGTISTIVRSYKAAVTFRIHLMRGMSNVPVWQHNYYEHVSRDDKDWQWIHTYVESNPAM